jgi:hypothetical protein
VATEDYRKTLIEAQAAASAAFDKAIMTLSGGALAISLTFIHDVAPHPKRQRLMLTSWSFLAFSLLIIVASFIASEHASWRALAAYDAGTAHPHGWGTFVAILNIIAGAAFIAGVAFLVAFAVYNL